VLSLTLTLGSEPLRGAYSSKMHQKCIGRTLGLVAIMPSWPPNWLFIRGIPDQLGLTAADDAKKLQFQMSVPWLKAPRIVPKGGPSRDT
jgi:hypothetical protein